jgi:1-acyl-sn-glycerol-3-phosphate acyltransferase
MDIKRTGEAGLRIAFFLAVRFCVMIFLGLNVHYRERLPKKGPAIIVANHNSHLDTLVLISLLPLARLGCVRPVAAADYFLRGPLRAWFFTRILRIIPIERSGANRNHDPLEPCREALDRGDILVLFPEGSRGEPEKIARFRTGIAHLAGRCPQAPVTPVFMYGLGKALPKGEWVFVPFFCDVFVGETIPVQAGRQDFMRTLGERFEKLGQQANHLSWEE